MNISANSDFKNYSKAFLIAGAVGNLTTVFGAESAFATHEFGCWQITIGGPEMIHAYEGLYIPLAGLAIIPALN